MANLEITMTLNEVWVHGQLVNPISDAWRPLGIYTTQQQADEACTLTNEFIGPIPLNQPWPDTTNWPRAYYPRRQI
jgi:hypothetical protein